MSIHPFLRALCCSLLGLLAAPAIACTYAETGGNLGSVPSFRVRNGPAITTSGNFSLSCSGVVLAALTGQPSVSATLASPATGLTLKNGTNSIPYQITQSNGTALTTGFVFINASGTTVVGLFSGNSSANVPINITTNVGANVPAGTYTDTIQVTWALRNICEGLLVVAGLCVGTPTNTDTTRSLLVTLTVTNDCVITAPNIAFGSAPLPSAFPTVSQDIGLLCTAGLSYTVGLSAGGHASAGQRRMASGTNFLAYDIFKASGALWGEVGGARAPGPAVADGLNLQTIPYNATVYPAQAPPPAGSYTDNVVVDVQF
ncbi:spore coat U domain-containing protein [Xylophilus sp. GW821-FHT01B05]